jgi:hypothetical protein
MQINCRVRQFRVTEQNLNGSEIRAGFQHVRGEAMPLPGLCRVLVCGPLLMGLKRFCWRHSSQPLVATLEG